MIYSWLLADWSLLTTLIGESTKGILSIFEIGIVERAIEEFENFFTGFLSAAQAFSNIFMLLVRSIDLSIL